MMIQRLTFLNEKVERTRRKVVQITVAAAVQRSFSVRVNCAINNIILARVLTRVLFWTLASVTFKN